MKDSVIEVLRSIAELVTYGDQHDPSIFEWVLSLLQFLFDVLVLQLLPYLSIRFFMEKQIMGEFARLLRISKMVNVALQLLQTISIMIQNLKSEHSICEFIYNLLSTDQNFTNLFGLWHDSLLLQITCSLMNTLITSSHIPLTFETKSYYLTIYPF